MMTHRCLTMTTSLTLGMLLGGCQNTELGPSIETAQPQPSQSEHILGIEEEYGEEEAPSSAHNRAPSIGGMPENLEIAAGEPFDFTPTASDPDGDRLTFSAQGLPEWARLDEESGRITGTPGAIHVGSRTTITIGVSDGTVTTLLPPFQIEVIDSDPAGTPPPKNNTPPVIAGSPGTLVSVGETYRFTPTTDDPDGDTISFSVNGLPSWATFDSSTGTIEGVPSEEDIGTHPSIIISASDGIATVSLLPFSITVSSPIDESGEVIYVDGTIRSTSCNDYSPESRSCGSGAYLAFSTLDGAAETAQPGDRVLIREGVYEEGLYPKNSGEPGRPITYSSFREEKALITGRELSPAIDISNLEYIVIRGLTIENVRRWLYARNAHHNRLEENTFLKALDPYSSSKTGVYFERATHNHIVGNTIEDSTADNLSLIDSDRNLVEGNRIRKAGHALWTIKCGDFNVLRNNYFHNAIQKIGEIYDCDGVGFENITAIDDTRRNLVESNRFAYTPPSGRNSPYAGIQYAGQQGIIRFNAFYETTGPALSMTLYGGEATRNWGNRVYHNVFYATSFAGISLARDIRNFVFFDNIFMNNILSDTRFVAHDTRWNWFTNELDGQAVQLKTGRLNGFFFSHNALWGNGDDGYLITHGGVSAGSPSGLTVTGWETAYPELFQNNLIADPMFQNPESGIFLLQGNSPLIDEGGFLTHTTTSGRGTAIEVQDASFFYDGFGIEGETGDEIQLEGRAERARIVSIDYTNNILHLDAPLQWEEGQGVSLSFKGARPDIGATEH